MFEAIPTGCDRQQLSSTEVFVSAGLSFAVQLVDEAVSFQALDDAIVSPLQAVEKLGCVTKW
jgi:hypothetical protein